MDSSHNNAILEAWDATLDQHADRAAILGVRGQCVRTFADIEREARRFSEVLGAGCDGAVIALQLGNSVLLPALLLAVWRHRCVPVLLDRSLDGPAREGALTACGAARFVALPSGIGPCDDTAFVVQRRDGTRFEDGTQFLKITSGTSTAPRAIRFTTAQLLADCESICETMGIGVADVNYGAIPWSHSYGFSNLVTPLLCRGVPVVATEDRLPRAILNGLAASGATVFPGLPVFFQKLCELGDVRPDHLRLCISAGAPLPMETAAAFRTKFGLKIHSFYGSSECGGITYDGSDEDVPQGCVGEAMLGVTIQHDEASGLIEINSPAVGLGYHPDPDPTVLGDGRFRPGDLVKRTAQGFVLTGRVSDFINVAGRKLNPLEVEHILRACPGVKEVVVFGAPHPTRGEEPIACLVGDASAADLQTHSARALAPWQIPRDFWFVQALPVNERGKLSRRTLAEHYARQPRAYSG